MRIDEMRIEYYECIKEGLDPITTLFQKSQRNRQNNDYIFYNFIESLMYGSRSPVTGYQETITYPDSLPDDLKVSLSFSNPRQYIL